ncbi:MAG: rhomboid family intramembrane serine protease [Aquihabitans sp.]
MSGDDKMSNRDIPDWMRPFATVVFVVAVMWVLEVIDLLPGLNLDQWGIRPRSLRGLIGIGTAPFLHNGFPHLISNTIPLLILGFLIAASGLQRFVQVMVVVMVVGGVGTWLTGASGSTHIGASGLVFGFLSYLLARAIFEKKILYLLGGMVVLFLYGSVLWGLIPKPGISWQGHIFGAVGGVVAAWMLHKPGDDALPDAKGLKA